MQEVTRGILVKDKGREWECIGRAFRLMHKKKKKMRKERDGSRKSLSLQCNSKKVSTRLLESPEGSTSQVNAWKIPFLWGWTAGPSRMKEASDSQLVTCADWSSQGRESYRAAHWSHCWQAECSEAAVTRSALIRSPCFEFYIILPLCTLHSCAYHDGDKV